MILTCVRHKRQLTSSDSENCDEDIPVSNEEMPPPIPVGLLNQSSSQQSISILMASSTVASQTLASSMMATFSVRFVINGTLCLGEKRPQCVMCNRIIEIQLAKQLSDFFYVFGRLTGSPGLSCSKLSKS